ncbi:MAG TPA: hypothetical protein VEK79_10090 [Thermoanaerobaculia bacterium]|nr:hypothetical protein [Thermoanaerobaculia bacterium]
MTVAEERLHTSLAEYQARVLLTWRGHEKELVFELARAIDEAAFAVTFPPPREPVPPGYSTILFGAATALRPLLPKLAHAPSGVPWFPTTAEWSRAADGHLMNCGRFANLLRLAALERYGLAEGTLTAPDRLLLEIENSNVEREDVEALHALRELPHDPLNRIIPSSRKLLRRIDRFVDVDREYFIRYDADDELIEYYHGVAAERAQRFLEGEALPPDARIGGRTFGEWLGAAIAASGRVLKHIAFSARLMERHPRLNLRDLITIFVRDDDAAAVLRESGEPEEYHVALFAAMTLDERSATDTTTDHEVPLPFYVDYGPDFALLPCFGALLNPIAAMVRFLKMNYRHDWDKAVARREEVFRADLRKIFPEPRFLVAPAGKQLYRPDGTRLTDIDAIVLDRTFGSLALMQLKWHDLYGRSLKERNSRRLNLLEANKWVQRVAGWVDGRSAAAIIPSIIEREPASADRPPCLFVVTRYAAQFARNDPYDLAAAWMGWADMVRAALDHPETDILSALFETFRGGRRTKAVPRETEAATYALPSLTVEVRAG